MATTNKQTNYATTFSHLLSTELNSLAAAAQIVSSVGGTSGVFDNSTNNDIWIDLRLSVTFGSAPTALTTVDVYFLRAEDGTNYPDGATTAPQPQLRVAYFEVRAVTTAQVMDCYDVRLPPGKWKVVVVNNTNQSFPVSGSLLDGYTHNMQAV